MATFGFYPGPHRLLDAYSSHRALRSPKARSKRAMPKERGRLGLCRKWAISGQKCPVALGARDGMQGSTKPSARTPARIWLKIAGGCTPVNWSQCSGTGKARRKVSSAIFCANIQSPAAKFPAGTKPTAVKEMVGADLTLPNRIRSGRWPQLAVRHLSVGANGISGRLGTSKPSRPARVRRRESVARRI
jgi:hypothetical protein